MLSYKEFYIWLEGYLHGKLNGNNVDILPIVDKMLEVKDVDPFFSNPKINVPTFEPAPIPPNPFKDDGYDDLGKPPKIVM
jgi:hypothetical protein